ncbi:uncharacterized protein At1g66480-like [Wolffia australiana]
MGNSFCRGKRVKVMKVDGSVVKIKPPATARDVLQSYPDHVLLESEDVKLHAHEAKPIAPDTALKPSKLYFVVQLPPLPETSGPRLSSRRVRSAGIAMSAKERLESLMLARRSASDVTFARANNEVRVRVRLSKAEVAKVVEESKNPEEAAKKIMELCAVESKKAEAPPSKEEVRRLPEKKEKRMRFALPEGEVVVRSREGAGKQIPA